MRALLCGLALFSSACVMPPPPAERATDAARNLNVAARFGRMDAALELTSEGMRQVFLDHRSSWGKELRVVDVELSGFSMPEGDRAEVQVDYSWSRVDETRLRSTRISQEYRDQGGGFRLVRERRLAGDVGLFGEPMPAPPTGPRRDVQFATKVIPER
jgi:hypothetical protein